MAWLLKRNLKPQNDPLIPRRTLQKDQMNDLKIPGCPSSRCIATLRHPETKDPQIALTNTWKLLETILKISSNKKTLKTLQEPLFVIY